MGKPPIAALMSFRLGGTDGVSVEAAKWQWALEQLGFEVRRVAGEIAGPALPHDVVLPALAIAPQDGVPALIADDVLKAIGHSQIVVVENACSLPLNLEASRTLHAALERWDGRVVFHHHDLVWQRAHLAHLDGEFPSRREHSLHIAINARSQGELLDRSIDAALIRNHFDLEVAPGDRVATRAAFGFGPGELIVLHPARAIPRKNVPGALEFMTRLGAALPLQTLRYWLTGPDEDGYGPTLSELLAATDVPYTIGRAPTPHDAYAACDLVVHPSTWEGFGNPLIESVVARRPIVVGHYPVLEEIRGLGFDFLSIDDVEEVADVLRSGVDAHLDHNFDVARRHFDLAALPAQIAAAFETAHWERR